MNEESKRLIRERIKIKIVKKNQPNDEGSKEDKMFKENINTKYKMISGQSLNNDLNDKKEIIEKFTKMILLFGYAQIWQKHINLMDKQAINHLIDNNVSNKIYKWFYVMRQIKESIKDDKQVLNLIIRYDQLYQDDRLWMRIYEFFKHEFKMHQIISSLDPRMMIGTIIERPHEYVIPTEQIKFTYTQAEKICRILNIQPDEVLREKARIYDHLCTNKSYICSYEIHQDNNKHNKSCLCKDITVTDNVLKWKEEYLVYRDLEGQRYYTSPYVLKEELEIYELMKKLIGTSPQVGRPQADIVKKNKPNIYSRNERLDENQIQAIETALTNNFYIITGCPGTGKTDMIINLINKIIGNPQGSVAVLAVTGKAISEIRIRYQDQFQESNVRQIICSTIASFKQKKKYCEDDLSGQKKKIPEDESKNVLKPTHILVDEASMLSYSEVKYLLKYAIREKCRITLIGDPMQLPPIGQGDFLRDSIKFLKADQIELYSNLTKIYRQDGGTLLEIIHAMYQNRLEPKIETLIHENERDIPYNINTMIIVADNKTRIIKNQEYQMKLNPNGEFICNTDKGYQFRINDKILCIKNSNDKDVEKRRYNGELFIIYSKTIEMNELGFPIHKYGVQRMSDSKTFFLEKGELSTDYELGYCITVHKAQGSQADDVMIYVQDDFLWTKLFGRKLLYTALSRCKKNCYIIGSMKTIKKCFECNRQEITIFYLSKYKSSILDNALIDNIKYVNQGRKICDIRYRIIKYKNEYKPQYGILALNL